MNKPNLYCHKCEKHQWKCECIDKNLRLNGRAFRIHSARLSVGFGGASKEQRRLAQEDIEGIKENNTYY